MQKTSLLHCCKLTLLASCLMWGVAGAELVLNKNFERVEPAVSVTVGKGKIEVREFFWYGCPHCFSIEPYLKKWTPAENVVFIRTPAVLGKRWEAHGYAYYALEQLGKIEEVHKGLFEALHLRNMKLNTPVSIAEFLEKEYKIDQGLFLKTYYSFAVSTKVNQAERLAKQYQLKSVPTFTVQGKYITSPSMEGVGPARLINVINELVKRENKG